MLAPVTPLAAFRMTPLTSARPPEPSGLWLAGVRRLLRRASPAPGGRALLRADETARGAAADVVVVSYEFWRDRFGRAPLTSQMLRVSGRDLRVIGVTPEGFQGTVLGLQFDLWVPAITAPSLLAGSAELIRAGTRLLRHGPAGDARPGDAGGRGRLRRDGGSSGALSEANRGMTAEVLAFWRASRGPQGFLVQALALLQGVSVSCCGRLRQHDQPAAGARQPAATRSRRAAGCWRRTLARGTAAAARNRDHGPRRGGAGALLAAWSAR